MRYLEHLKKIFVLSVAALSIAIVNASPASAFSMTENYLQQIAQYTGSILQFLQNPANFAGVGVSLMQQDTGDSSIITVAQQGFAKSGWSATKSQSLTADLQKQVMADILGVELSELSGKNPPIADRIPSINDLAYVSLTGKPLVEGLSFEPYNYIKKAAAIDSRLPFINKTWKGEKEAKKRYKQYFDTITAIKSFNAYVLSKTSFDLALKLDETRNDLVNSASSSEWIARIATTELGRIFRQILLFESQNFVLNVQIEKDLRNMVASQAMTNTLLIELNAVNEKNLRDAAEGSNLGQEQSEYI